MRSGPRALFLFVLLFAALCAPARAASTLSVFVDNNKVGLGTATTFAAHAEMDATFGGGHIAYKYRLGSDKCAADPASDPGTDVPDASAVAAGPGQANVGGQKATLALGSWMVCGWLVDDVNGGVVASSSTDVVVVPFIGSILMAVQRSGQTFRVKMIYTSSEAARLFLSVQRAGQACTKRPPGRGVQVLPRKGLSVGTTGTVSKSVSISRMSPGNWRTCAWLRGKNGASAPVSRAFVVPKGH